MSNSKLVMSQAANSWEGPTYIEDVFSTYLYTGNGSTQTITNGIDLDGEGGMVWIKSRSFAADHFLFDTDRGALQRLISNKTNEEVTFANTLTSFNADGFSVGSFASVNFNAENYASWTFRKAPRFFDVVTFVATSSSNQRVSHNLGVPPGAILVKSTSASESWKVYHESLGRNSFLYLNLTNAAGTATDTWGTSDPTDTDFGVNSSFILTPGYTYVAYLFAHDPLGPSGDGSDGLIACGSYTGNGSSTGPEINLGWEPQWVLLKRTDTTANWFILDSMRGLVVNGSDQTLQPNNSDAENSNAFTGFNLTPTGFKLVLNDTTLNASGGTYIYIAIRRGPMRQPTSGTEVFAVDNGDGSSVPSFASGFPVDFGMLRDVGVDGFHTSSRLTSSKTLDTYNTAAEGSNSNYRFDYQNGWFGSALSSNYYSWMFRRAPGFFDVVAYTGNGVAGRTVSHNLGVAPEMLIFKRRDAVRNWAIVHSGATNRTVSQPPVLTGYDVSLNFTVDGGLGGVLNGTAPTADVVTLSSSSDVNISSGTYISYLFASVAGVSKCGSYTGNGSSQTINCGFTSGARFVLIKRCDDAGDWYVWDSARGIVAGNDPHLSLNTTAAEVTSDDSIDPDSSGFIVNQVAATNVNVSSASYIYLAIA